MTNTRIIFFSILIAILLAVIVMWCAEVLAVEGDTDKINSLSADWLTLLVPIAIGGIGFWLRSTIKDILEKSSNKVAGKMDALSVEIRNLSDKLSSEITLSTHERQTEGVWQQINQQHVSENSAEHERMIDAIKEVSDQNAKQTEVLREVVTILKGR